MTFSIVAADLARGDWGVAVASKFVAVGAVVPAARAGVGAVATQAWANVAYAPDGLAMLAEGRPADDVVRALVDGDDGRDQRQLGVVDASGRAATFTGERCMDWAGGLAEEGFACQGNILTGPEVVQEMVRAALLVVRAEGGYGGRSDRYVDVRVDDHEEPVRELRRTFSILDAEYLVRNDPLVPITDDLVRELQRRLAASGHYAGPETGAWDVPTRDALEAFAGEFNLEGRLRSDDQLSEMLIREIRDVTPEVRP